MGLLDQLKAYIEANTPRATRPVAKPSDVIRQGLLDPNKYNAPAANRFKDSLFGLLGIVPGVGDAASAAESADLFNRGEKFAGGMAALGALPLVPAIGGMFIGKGAKTWDALKAQQAEELLKAGTDPREVWKQTGTAKFSDGMLRQEIPDTRAGMRLEGPKFGREIDSGYYDDLSEVLDHVEAYKAYPDTKRINTTWSDAASGGSYSAPRKEYQYIDLPLQANKETKRSTALHELQHAIQQREGWARGGSPESMDAMFRELSDEIYKYDLAVRYGKDELRPKLEELKKARDMLSGSDFDNYKRLAGEAEARLTQSRMNLDAAQRLQHYPYDMGEYGLDVPMDQLVVRGLLGEDMGPAMSYADEAAQKANRWPFGNARPTNAAGEVIHPTQYELAQTEAQRVAALPVEQGGLGLPPNNTAMDRAKAMGFDTTAYHGTANDVTEFKNSELGKTTRADSSMSHHFFAENPWSSNAYTWSNLYEGVPEKYVVHTDLGRMLKKTTPKEYRDLIDSRYDLMEQARKQEKDRVVGLFESKEPLKTKKWTDDRGFNFSQTDFNEQGLRDFAQEYGLPYKGQGPVEFTRSIAGPINTFSDAEHMYHLRDELASQAGASAAAVALGKSPNIMPVMLNTGKTKETSGALIRGDNGESLLTNILRRNKNYDTVKLTDITDGGPTTTHYAIKDPSRIRSRFAAFDPAKRDSSDLLAGLAPYIGIGGLLSLGLLDQYEPD